MSDLDASLALHAAMVRIRVIEERIADEYGEQEMRCPVHLSIGQEAAAVAACAALRPDDLALSGHRSHSHYLAKGGDLRAMMAEILGRSTGCAGGYGGSMHLIDLGAGFLGAAPIVGSTIPIAVGVAFASRRRQDDRVTMVFFGDGAVEAGVFHESVNFAALHRLPVVFLCENNLYSVYSPLEVRQPAGRPIVDLAAAHGILAVAGDGNNVESARDLVSDAVEHARAGNGPAFVELSTYRWREHCGPGYDNDLGYRTVDEFESWRKLDPVVRHHDELVARGVEPSTLAVLHTAAGAEMDDAMAFARSSPFPVSEAAT